MNRFGSGEFKGVSRAHEVAISGAALIALSIAVLGCANGTDEPPLLDGEDEAGANLLDGSKKDASLGSKDASLLNATDGETSANSDAADFVDANKPIDAAPTSCPTGLKLCSGGCFECCSATDCPAHVQCMMGTCGECEPNFDDCDKNATNGCETDLSHEPNCGSCGTTCCSVFCGCVPFYDGKSCSVSGGGTYGCHC